MPSGLTLRTSASSEDMALRTSASGEDFTLPWGPLPPVKTSPYPEDLCFQRRHTLRTSAFSSSFSASRMVTVPWRSVCSPPAGPPSSPGALYPLCNTCNTKPLGLYPWYIHPCLWQSLYSWELGKYSGFSFLCCTVFCLYHSMYLCIYFLTSTWCHITC